MTMPNNSIDEKYLNSIRRMTSRQQIIVYSATLMLDSPSKKWYDSLDELHVVTGLSRGTIKEALYFLFLDNHL